MNAGRDIPAWMLRGAGSLADAAAGLRESASELARVEQELTRLLADCASTLGWRGDAAEAAEARQSRHGTQLDQTAEALLTAATALLHLEQELDEVSPRLHDLRARRVELVSRSIIERFLPVTLQVTLQVFDLVRAQELGEIRDIDRDIAAGVARLADADTLARDRLDRVLDELRRLGRLAAGDEWLGTAAPLGVLAILSRYGVVEDCADRLLLSWAELLPPGEAGTSLLRARLAALSPDEAADLLLRHPGLARRLSGELPPRPEPGSPEAALAAALAASQSDPAARIAGIATAFAAMSAGQRRMLALLYPELVGRLDGAPLDDRMAANRVQIAAALQREREIALMYARAVRDRSDVQAWKEDANDALNLLTDVPDVAAAQARNRGRIAYYQRLLYEEVDNPAQSPGRPALIGHQILYFDPRGDGTIAEMWGALDGQTKNLACPVRPPTWRTSADTPKRCTTWRRRTRPVERRPSPGWGWTCRTPWYGTLRCRVTPRPADLPFATSPPGSARVRRST